ncbi:MAG: translocation/assembly module TamB domain-containing protein [Bacteroidota bacterium]
MPAFFCILLQSNIVQTWLGKRLSNFLTENYHTQISVEKVDIRFFLEVTLKNVYVADNQKNTLLKSGKILIDMDEFSLETNYLSINNLAFENTYFNLRRYKNSKKTNIEEFVDLFGKVDTSSTKKKIEYPLKIKIGKLTFYNSGFSFIDDRKIHNNNETMDFDDIQIKKLNIDMEEVAIYGDSVAAKIKNIALNEKSGFILSNFSGKTIVSKKNIIVNNLLITTPYSQLDLDLKFSYEDFNSFNNFVNQVTITSTIRKTALNSIDIAYYAKELTGMNNKIFFSTEVKGKINNLKIKHFDLKYGSNTTLNADITMNGLPNIDETYINLKIRKATSSVQDLNNIVIPLPNRKITHLLLPEILKRLGKVNLKGIITGFYSDFVAYATIQTDVGSASTDIILSNSDNTLTYNGKIKTENFDLGLMMKQSDIFGKVSLDAQIIGSGFTTKTASFKVNGKMNLFEFKDYKYTNININGGLDKMVYTGLIAIADENLQQHFNGTLDLNDTLPSYNFTSKIDYANLKKLNLFPKDSISEFNGDLKINFKGNNIDNLQGTIFVEKAHFIQNNKLFSLNSLMLETHINKTGYRTFDLKSDYIDAIFKGYFVFMELPNSIKRFVLVYLPNLDFKLDSNITIQPRQEFDFVIKLYNATPVIKFFVPEAKISGNTSITGNFNSINNTTVIGATSSELYFYGKKLTNCKIDINATPKNIDLVLNTDSLKFSDSSWLSNLNIKINELNDSLLTRIVWNNNKRVDKNEGNINFYTYFYSNDQTIFGFKPSTITIDDSIWSINTKGTILFDTTTISFNNVLLYRKLQSISINGDISKSPLDVIAVKFTDFDISNLDYLTNAKNFDLDGIVTGNVYLSDFYGKPTYYSDIIIKNLGFNHDKLGDAKVLNKWDSKKKGISIIAQVDYVGAIGTSTPLIVSGYYFPTNNSQNFDINIDIDNLRLKPLSRYIASFGTIVSGTAIGNIKVTGTNKNPQLLGNIKLLRTFLHVNYLNTTYSFAYDSVKITNTDFSFKNLVVIDQPYNDTAIVNGRISHNNFRNIIFDFFIAPKKLFSLNTTPTLNEMFYGRAFATGNVHIYGTPSKIKMDIIARTDKGTQLFIPVGGTTSLSTNDYISFVDKTIKINELDDKGKELTGIDLDMLINATDDAEIQIMFDPKAGDRIKGKGNGNIRLTVNSTGDLLMFGDYSITSGDYLFTFQNIINKRFIIDEGGTIKWNGDPYSADLDITARYKLKANLGSLGVSSGDSNRTIPVECIIKIRDMLSNPTFSFDVDLPTLTEFEKGPYISAINQNINNNFISLLIINSFVNSGNGIGQSTLSNANFLGKSASEVLSNQLTNWLSMISKDIDIGVNYRPGDNISQEEIEVALSTQILNDRVNIESNLGVNTGKSNSKNSNQIIGDVNIEVKINKALKFRVFNRTNQYDVLQFVAPYTQGIGITYRKEFNTKKDPFIKKKKSENKTQLKNKTK